MVHIIAPCQTAGCQLFYKLLPIEGNITLVQIFLEIIIFTL